MEAPSLARSGTLQEHIWELGGTLASGTSLRLEITLLAACLRGQSPKSESLSWLCLQSVWIEALLVTMGFWGHTGHCRIWSGWKCGGLLPLEALALCVPEEARWWLFSQLPRYSFCGICGNELEALALVAWGKKKNHFFLIGQPSTTSFAILVWWHSKGTSRLLFIPSWLTSSTVVRTVLRNVHGHT